MKTKFWFSVSLLIVLSLVLAACGAPTVTEVAENAVPTGNVLVDIQPVAYGWAPFGKMEFAETDAYVYREEGTTVTIDGIKFKVVRPTGDPSWIGTIELSGHDIKYAPWSMTDNLIPDPSFNWRDASADGTAFQADDEIMFVETNLDNSLLVTLEGYISNVIPAPNHSATIIAHYDEGNLYAFWKSMEKEWSAYFTDDKDEVPLSQS